MINAVLLIFLIAASLYLGRLLCGGWAHVGVYVTAAIFVVVFLAARWVSGIGNIGSIGGAALSALPIAALIVLCANRREGWGREGLIIDNAEEIITVAVIALVFVITLVLSLSPLSAFAADSNGDSLDAAEVAAVKAEATENNKILSLDDNEFAKTLKSYGLENAKINHNSLPSQKQDRVFEDALSIPLEGKTTDELMTSLEDEFRNPTWLTARFERLTEIALSDGTRLSELYPALSKYVDLYHEHGPAYFVESDGETLTSEYLRYAVLGKLLFAGQSVEVSLLNNVTTEYVWRLKNIGYDAEGNLKTALVQPYKTAYVEESQYATVLVIEHRVKSTERVAWIEYFDIYDRAPVTLKSSESGLSSVFSWATGGGGGTTPTPSPSPTPPTPTPYNKDKSQGVQGDLVAPNDDPGPGSNTNGGGNTSTADRDDTSTSYNSYEEYKKEMEEMARAQKQKTGGSDNTPSTPSGGAAVDNNGDSGTGYGGIDEPTPYSPPVTDASTGEQIDDTPGEAWGGPPD